MREATLSPRQLNSGWALLGLGLATLALALALWLITLDDNPPAMAPINLRTNVSTVDQTIAFWEARIAADPADFVAYNRLANAYILRARESGDVTDYGRAQSAVDASLAKLPGENPAAYATLAVLQNVRHEFAAAVESARHAMELDPTDIGALASLGDAQLALGRYDDAFATYNDLVTKAPGLSSFSRLAHIHEIRGDLGEAEAAWQNAFSTDDGRSAEATAWARVQFGNFYFNQGDTAAARVEYATALDTLPGYVHAIAAQARLDAASGDYEGAIDRYTTATERQPLPEYVAALGDVHRLAGNEAEAQRQYALVEAIDELYAANGIDTDLQLALFFADHDIRLDDALTAALGVYEGQPDSIYGADVVAWTLYKAGRAEEAVPYAGKALRLDTPDANLFFHAGLVYAATGDEARARDNLRRALEVNADFSLINAPIAERTLEDLGE